MAENIIINASGAALGVQGETTGAWTVAESTGAPTDAEVRALIATNSIAMMQTGASAAEKAGVAFCILDSLLGASVDLSTAQKRKAYKAKAGLQEYVDILSKLQVADLA